MFRLLALGFALVLASTLPAFSQDPAKVGPNIYNCVFENERTRVCEVTFKPGDRIAPHSHPDHLVYAMSAGKIVISPVGAAAIEADVKPGMVLWTPAETHSAVNTGKTDVRLLVVEMKEVTDEMALMQIERDWGKALIAGDTAAMDRFVAPEWTLTNPMGHVESKADADAALRSGDLDFESMTAQDLKVKVYGDTAIVTGQSLDKAKYKGQDVSGTFRFTDVFVKREGKWVAISTHVTPVVNQ
jgi:quercetin dioxygenase-like cupin family protein